MLECVANLSEGRRTDIVEQLAGASGPSLLDVHVDPDHHRSVFTLAGPGSDDAEPAARRLAQASAERLSLSDHVGVHPRVGAIDVVPFVALEGSDPADAAAAARRFREWITRELDVPSYLYGEADPQRRSLPEIRKLALLGSLHPRLGAVAVGARPVLVAVNCNLDHDDVALARAIAGAVRERDGGLPGVRALGFRLGSRAQAQVSMNLTDLGMTGVERACSTVREHARNAGVDVVHVELVGLLPRAELERCSRAFREWSGITDDHTIEARLERQRVASRHRG
jgi:glutamate formiminotransferase / 5-formyltetrahydrofolate cyclo-ligase